MPPDLTTGDFLWQSVSRTPFSEILYPPHVLDVFAGILSPSFELAYNVLIVRRRKKQFEPHYFKLDFLTSPISNYFFVYHEVEPE